VADRVYLDVEPLIGAILASVDDAVAKGVLDGARVVAEQAAAVHPYTNRTGNLQRRTQAGRVVGRASRGLVRVDVLGDTRYGSFVEEGTSRNRAYPYLAPAWLVRESDFARIVDEALTRGLERVL
jgi:hypothetical protein